MADWSRRKTQRRDWAWYRALAVFVGVPFFLGALALLREVWSVNCLRLGLSETATCKSTGLIIVIAAVLGAVGIVILLWWVLSELTGLRRIFESRWVGVGEDVENAGVMESMLRAALFVLALWLCIAMLFPYVMSVARLQDAVSTDGHDGKSPTTPTGGAASTDHAVVEQLRLTNSTLQSVKELLVQQGKDLSALSVSQKSPTNPGPGMPSSDPAAIEQLKLTNSILQSVKEVLVQQGRHLGALDAIKEKIDGWKPAQGPSSGGGISTDETARIDHNVQTIAEQISEQGRRLVVLDQIYLVLQDKLRPQPVGKCFDYVADAPPATKPETAGPASPGTVNRYRTAAAVRPVFFDRGSSALSDWAKQDISWFLRETNARDGKLAIFGSTDPQGTEAQNGLLAKKRALAIQQFIEGEKTPHQIINVKSATEDGTPKSEPYKRVATIRLLEPCPQ